ncbi:putative ribonuclease H-like domain-containing protein [Tanacetum coccineum]|uniref:Ribonuclease H-like domain-containing protein n=1 Tax=Tanacetum coccineum TaxID=301880 RepID=A0ABQ5DHQ4_9ASTR
MITTLESCLYYTTTVRLVPSCCVVFDLKPFSLSFDFVFSSKIFKSFPCLSSSSCDLVSWYRHDHHLESLLTISLDNLCLDNLYIFKGDLEYQSCEDLFDVDSGRISIVTVNTKEYHSDEICPGEIYRLISWLWTLLVHFGFRDRRLELTTTFSISTNLEYGYIKNHKKTVKNGQARTRESEEYKAKARKVKPQSKSAKKSQRKTTKASSTDSFNTVSTPVYAASAPRTSNDAGPSSVSLGRSFPLNVNDLPDDLLMPDLEDTAVQEPTKITQALDDESWVEAMQKELLRFKIQKVWTLVDLPYGKKAIGTKWVYRNKKDERGIVMDVKSAFLYDTIKEDVYVSQPLSFVDPEFPDKVYKVEKALYGLQQALRAWYETLSTYLLDNGFYRDFEQIMHKRFQMSSMGELTFFLGLQVKQKEDGIFISQDKYVGEILKKFGFSSIRTASTPMETNKALTKDEDGEDVDVHLYRSMIGSLMYLTSSRPDIMFSVCACSRFQVQPKVSHLNALFQTVTMQVPVWTRNPQGGCQFLGSRLISWQCKKQTVVANSTTEAEYIAASHCCGQVLWIQNQMLDYGYNFMQTKIHVDNESAICVVKNPVYHSKTKHIEIRHHFIRDSYEKRLIEMVKIHTDNNVADLLTKAFDVSTFNFLVASICMLNL